MSNPASYTHLTSNSISSDAGTNNEPPVIIDIDNNQDSSPQPTAQAITENEFAAEIDTAEVEAKNIKKYLTVNYLTAGQVRFDVVEHATATKKYYLAVLGHCITYFAMLPQGIFAALLMDDLISKENLLLRVSLDAAIFTTGIVGKERIVFFFSRPNFENLDTLLTSSYKDLINYKEWTKIGILRNIGLGLATIEFTGMFAGLTVIAMDKGAEMLRDFSSSLEPVAIGMESPWGQLLFVASSIICNALSAPGVCKGGYYTIKSLLHQLLTNFTPLPSNANKFYIERMRFHLKELFDNTDVEDKELSYKCVVAASRIIKKEAINRQDNIWIVSKNIASTDLDIKAIKQFILDNNLRDKHFNNIVEHYNSKTLARSYLWSHLSFGVVVSTGFLNFFSFASQGPKALFGISYDEKASLTEISLLDWILGSIGYGMMISMAYAATGMVAKNTINLLHDLFSREQRQRPDYISGINILGSIQTVLNNAWSWIICLVGSFPNIEQAVIVGSGWALNSFAAAAPTLQEKDAFFDISNNNDVRKLSATQQFLYHLDKALQDLANSPEAELIEKSIDNIAYIRSQSSSSAITQPATTLAASSLASLFSASSSSSSSNSDTITIAKQKQIDYSLLNLLEEQSDTPIEPKKSSRGCFASMGCVIA